MSDVNGSDIISSRFDLLDLTTSNDYANASKNLSSLSELSPPIDSHQPIQKQSFSSSSSTASHSSFSTETDCTSNNLSESSPSKVPISAIMSYNEKQHQQKQSSPLVYEQENQSDEIPSGIPLAGDLDEDTISESISSESLSTKPITSNILDTPRRVSDNYKNFPADSTPTHSTSSFLPLELSFANDDFSSLILKDFSRSTFNFSQPPLPGSLPTTESSLGRKNTISVKGKVSTTTTQSQTSPNVFERMRSIRVSTARSVSGSSRSAELEPTLKDEINPETPVSPVVSVIESSNPFEATSVERGNSVSSNFTTWSSSTSSSKNPQINKNLLPPSQTSLNILSSPSRTPSTTSSTSNGSFDSHIAAQLCTIPSPVLNAISFSPPTNAVIVSTEDNEDVDAISIFSEQSETHLGRGRSFRTASAETHSKKSLNEENELNEDDSRADVVEEKKDENSSKEKTSETDIDPEDRGRLFVRVEGLQNLQLPILSHRNPRFNMTLDNGVQSVTIDSLPITATNPGVNQEFELVVGEDLQFILTFQAFQDPAKNTPPLKTEEEIRAERERERIEMQKEAEEERKRLLLQGQERLRREKEARDAEAAAAAASQPTTPQGSPKKQSKFRSIFSSPKKKHSAALSAASQQGLSQNAIRSTTTTRAIQNTTALRTRDLAAPPKLNILKPSISKPSPPAKKPKDIWEGLVGPHGEFGRCYLVESQYEKEVYGRSRTFNITLYNEWAYKEVTMFDMNKENTKSNGSDISTGSDSLFPHAGSTSNSLIIKKVPLEPSKIASLQITFMYIPRATMGGKLPPSMKAAIRELSLMKTYKSISLDGYLSQEGGDCNYWRRRWFTLRGAELVGHTEDTKKVRSVMNLTNVSSIVDFDQMSPQDKREMMASCLYYDRAFRVTFKDGEEITFYADSIDSKDAWFEALNISVTYCTGNSYEWTDVVIGYHEYEKMKLAEQRSARVQS
ncbi:uncharacterized protein SAPINGB_P003722 [Magnusiomyces paraingens]|uniref:PH domain-containing protein n=1 Tax=Magnusiomyces paraingens TaxID=2606893 RepID=A0A5E8BQW4_9ASCO|nr:uncharacterized protein SAPINGB_P003722 [Saprochaete ingens]VVT53733.1 unnamed protein product [Saprochaete ingens]